MSLAKQPLLELLSAVADPTPAPGGGSAAAVAGALAAALVEMAATIELARGKASKLPGELPGRARGLRLACLDLAEDELSSYAPVLEARRLEAGDPSRDDRLRTALAQASRSPLAIADAAAQVAQLGAEVAAGAEPSVRGDALTGVRLAAAAAEAAAGLVEINLATQQESDLLDSVRQAGATARHARRRAEAISKR